MWVDALFVDAVDTSSILSILISAYKTADQLYGEAEALQWAGGFQFPHGIMATHACMFEQADWDIFGLIREMKARIAPRRLSAESVRATISVDNPEYEKLLRLVDGMPLFTAPGFVPSSHGKLSGIADSYKRLSSVVDRMLFEDFVSQGLAIVLPKELVLAHVTEFHFSRLSWTPKNGKVKGRPITDCSAGSDSINSDFTKLSSDVAWGVIKHPTIEDFVQMVQGFFEAAASADPSVVWEDLVLWKIDLRGAYTLLSFEDAAVPLMSAELAGEAVIMFLCGVFGWSGTPAAFQVVSRALKVQINISISGQVTIYVDDLFGVSLRRTVDDDIRVACSICCALFNSECIEPTKTTQGRRVTVIGFDIDLDLMMVTVADKNYLRTIYGLSTIGFGGGVPVKTLQKFASWISRYASICTILRPLSRVIYGSYSGMKNQFVRVRLPEDAQRALRLFRALFILSIAREDVFARPMESYRSVDPQVIVEFDASLFGGGVIVRHVVGDRQEVVLGSACFSLESLKFYDESAFQNTAEFIAAVIGLVVAARFCGYGTRIQFRGDSMSALAWLEKGQARSAWAFKVSTVFTYVCLKNRFHICESQHISAGRNTAADFLSRHVETPQGSLEVDALPLIQLIDPGLVINTDQEYIDFWRLMQVNMDYLIDSVKCLPTTSYSTDLM